MPDDEIVTLDSGEQVRVDIWGDQHLIPGPDPELTDAADAQESKEERLAELKQIKLDALAQKRDALVADPAVPPEKRIF